jgi:rubrerythrin
LRVSSHSPEMYAGSRHDPHDLRCHNVTIRYRRGGPQVSDEYEQGEAVPLNWACTNCGYHVEGEPPEQCPECGEGREMFDVVPIPGY